MRLANFILANKEAILLRWEEFAQTRISAAQDMNRAELRDHAGQLLDTIAAELNSQQNLLEQARKPTSQGPTVEGKSAPEVHALTRLLAGFTIDEIVSEYHALRASVLLLWGREPQAGDCFAVEDISRFNVAIDRALAESIARYTAELSESRHVFLAILGHDLRTPLGAISMGAQFLMQAGDTPPLEGMHIKVASRMYSSAQRAGKIVDNLLDFTRSHLSGGIPIQRTETNLCTVAESVVEELRVFHFDRTIQFEAAGNSDGEFDGPRMAQVFSNLTANALQHGYADTGITVKIQGNPEAIVFSVHNEGRVIPHTEFSRIFNPLTRHADDAAQRGPRSSLGLGLYIAREIVHAHGGCIKVSSAENLGTTFTVCLPRKAPAA